MAGLAIVILLIINAAVGLFCFEYAWKVSTPIREVNEVRDSKYPAFRR